MHRAQIPRRQRTPLLLLLRHPLPHPHRTRQLSGTHLHAPSVQRDNNHWESHLLSKSSPNDRRTILSHHDKTPRKPVQVQDSPYRFPSKPILTPVTTLLRWRSMPQWPPHVRLPRCEDWDLPLQCSAQPLPHAYPLGVRSLTSVVYRSLIIAVSHLTPPHPVPC